MGLTDKLVKFATADVPEEAAAMMRLSLFDWAACGIAGARQEAFVGFRRAQLVEEGPAHVFGGDATGPAQAALINGTLGHALDYGDMHFAYDGHPSAAVLPAVIALAETLDIRLTDVVDAASIGAEAAIMVGAWLGEEHGQIGYDQTAIAGTVGATLAAARLLGLDKPQISQALGLSAGMASGLKAQIGTVGAALNAGRAARAGVEAALWAQVGMTGAQGGLEGPLGLGATHHAEASEVKIPRKEWQVTDINHKFHACCHGLHASLEALSATKILPKRITSIKIRTHPRWLELCNIAAPKTGREAMFSYTQTAAMVLLGHGTSLAEGFTDELTRDKDIRALRKRIEVSGDDALTETQAQIRITLESGGVRRLRHDLRAPMTLEARSAKLRAKVKLLLGAGCEASLWDAVTGPELDAVTACFAATE